MAEIATVARQLEGWILRRADEDAIANARIVCQRFDAPQAERIARGEIDPQA